MLNDGTICVFVCVSEHRTFSLTDTRPLLLAVGAAAATGTAATATATAAVTPPLSSATDRAHNTQASLKRFGNLGGGRFALVGVFFDVLPFVVDGVFHAAEKFE